MPRPRTGFDMLAYQRRYHTQRRSDAKARGICIQCNADQARPGFTKCADCARISSLKRTA